MLLGTVTIEMHPVDRTDFQTLSSCLRFVLWPMYSIYRVICYYQQAKRVVLLRSRKQFFGFLKDELSS